MLEDGLEISYPKDLAQVPDVFVHLIKGEGTNAIACSGLRTYFRDDGAPA